MGQNCLAKRSAYSGLVGGGGLGIGSASGQAQPATNNSNNTNRPKLLFILPYYTAFYLCHKGLAPSTCLAYEICLGPTQRSVPFWTFVPLKTELLTIFPFCAIL